MATEIGYKKQKYVSNGAERDVYYNDEIVPLLKMRTQRGRNFLILDGRKPIEVNLMTAHPAIELVARYWPSFGMDRSLVLNDYDMKSEMCRVWDLLDAIIDNSK